MAPGKQEVASAAAAAVVVTAPPVVAVTIVVEEEAGYKTRCVCRADGMAASSLLMTAELPCLFVDGWVVSLE